MNLTRNVRYALLAAILSGPAFANASSYMESNASAQPAEADCGGAVEQTRADASGEPNRASTDIRQSDAANENESERVARDTQATTLREEGRP